MLALVPGLWTASSRIAAIGDRDRGMGEHDGAYKVPGNLVPGTWCQVLGSRWETNSLKSIRIRPVGSIVRITQKSGLKQSAELPDAK